MAELGSGTIPPAQVMQQLGSPEVECVAFATPPIVTKVLLGVWSAGPKRSRRTVRHCHRILAWKMQGAAKYDDGGARALLFAAKLVTAASHMQ